MGAEGATATDAFRVRRHVPQAGATELVDVVRAWLAGDDAAQPRDIAVLTRVGSLLLAPHVALVEAGVPVASILRPDVLNRTGLRAALAYVRIAAGADRIDPRDLIEVYRRPSRGLPNWIERWLGRCGSVEDVQRAAGRIDDVKVAAKVDGLASDLVKLAALAHSGSTRSILEHVRDAVGLGQAVELLDATGLAGESHRDDLEALLQVADLHPDPGGFEPWLRSALTRPRDDDGVALSTIHRVKGREWPRVVIFGATDGIMPHRLSHGRSALEEERRVFHVAITRAIDQVAVLADASRPSPFLGELDRDATPAELKAELMPGPERPGRTAAPGGRARAPGRPLRSRSNAPRGGAARVAARTEPGRRCAGIRRDPRPPPGGHRRAPAHGSGGVGRVSRHRAGEAGGLRRRAGVAGTGPGRRAERARPERQLQRQLMEVVQAAVPDDTLEQALEGALD